MAQSLSGRAKVGVGNGRLRVIWAIARKDIGESVRSSQFAIMGILPLIIFLIYRLMVSGIDNSSILDIAVYDEGSSQLVRVMQANEALILHMVDGEAALQAQIHEVGMSGVQIPAGFDEAVAAGAEPPLTIWLNPPRGMQSETTNWQRFVEMEILRLGQQNLPAQIEWLTVDNGTPFSTETTLNSYLLVIVLTLILFMTGANVVAMLIAEEKDKKTAVMLTTSPAQIGDIVWGKALAGTLYIVVMSAVVIFINGGLTGNRPLVLLYLGLSLPVAVSTGILIGSLTQSAKQCNSWLGLVMLLLLIPGWFQSLLKLPEPFGSIIHTIPTQFLVAGLNDALNQTMAAANTATNLTVWTGFMLAMVAVTVWRIQAKPQSMIV